MRSEKEMYDLILNEAKNNPHIKAVMLNGSRTNPNVTKDRLQDFDIVYVVDQMEYFLNNDYVKRFGEIAIMQTPNKMELFENENSETFAYLMQFKDGNRIDLTLMSEELVEKYCYQDQLAKVLYDPMGIFKPILEASDASHYVKKTTQQQFYDCCNECYWVATYVAKGLVRHELNYALKHLNENVREMLLMMLSWKVGYEHHYQISVGKHYKYLEKYLEANSWQQLLTTYPTADYESIWIALFNLLTMMNEESQRCAKCLGYDYHLEEFENTYHYITALYHNKNIP